MSMMGVIKEIDRRAHTPEGVSSYELLLGTSTRTMRVAVKEIRPTHLACECEGHERFIRWDAIEWVEPQWL